MATAPHDNLAILRTKLAQQRSTVESLKRDGHDHADAERQLLALEAELRLQEPRLHKFRRPSASERTEDANKSR